MSYWDIVRLLQHTGIRRQEITENATFVVKSPVDAVLMQLMQCVDASVLGADRLIYAALGDR